jgi:UDP-N-acetylmuramyl pentapeptide synthase
VFRCDDAEEALGLLACIVEPDDVILVKASRAVGLETVAEDLSSPAFMKRKLVANV